MIIELGDEIVVLVIPVTGSGQEIKVAVSVKTESLVNIKLSPEKLNSAVPGSLANTYELTMLY